MPFGPHITRRDFLNGALLGGHAYSVPFPGFFGGAAGRAPRDIMRKRHGRIAFAHSELAGWQHWGTAADEGRRAFNQLVDTI